MRTKIITLTPAYRDYNSKKEVQTALDNGKDFIIADFMHPSSGRYCNKQDLISMGLKTVMTMIQSFKIK